MVSLARRPGPAIGPHQAGSPGRAAARQGPAQPLQQPGITGRGGRELMDAEQPADRVERGSDVHIGVRVHPAGDGACLRACLYDGHCHPFLKVDGLRDGTHPLAARTCEPWPLAQARQIRPAAPVGALRLGPADRSFAGQPETASADSEVRPDPGPTLRPHHRITSEAAPGALSTSSLPNLARVVWIID